MTSAAKRIVCLLLAISMTFFYSGCVKEPETGQSAAAQKPQSFPSAEPSPAETAAPDTTRPILPLDDSQMADPAVFAAELSPLTPLPGREGLAIHSYDSFEKQSGRWSYANCAQGEDLYPNASPHNTWRSFWMSYDPWVLETFQANTSLRSDFQVDIREYKPELAPQLNPSAQPDALPYYLYACWRGMDWKSLAQLEYAVREHPEDQTAIQARDAFRDQYLEDFRALQPEDLPKLPYFYIISYRFPADAEGGSIVDDPASEMIYEIQMGENPGEAGEIGMAVHAEDPRPLETPGLRLTRPGYEALAAPLNDGDCACLAMEFTADEDITLKGFALYQSKLEIREILLTRSGNGRTVEEAWDGESELKLEAGETVQIRLTLHDPEAENMAWVIWPDGACHGHDPAAARPEDYVQWFNSCLGEYCRAQFCMLSYEAKEGPGKAAAELVLRRDLEPWEMILGQSCDVDNRFSTSLYSYYLDYWNPLFNPAWQGERPG